MQELLELETVETLPMSVTFILYQIVSGFLLLGVGNSPANIGAADVSLFYLMPLFHLHF